MFIIILLILLIYLYYYTKPNIYFLSKYETISFFIKDYDNILNKQNDNNILNKWCNSASNFSNYEKNKIIKSINYMRKCIRENIKNIKLKNQLLSIDLIFSKTIGDKYLYGLAHTRFNIIFLNKKIIKKNNIKQLATYIIHEMSHIWQRIYKKEMIKWLQLSGYYIIKKYNYNIYFNPDIDYNIYNNIYSLQYKYNYDNINDLLYNYIMNFHPYEIFAYNMEKYIK